LLGGSAYPLLCLFFVFVFVFVLGDKSKDQSVIVLLSNGNEEKDYIRELHSLKLKKYIHACSG
jgi:hypothetical protein